MSDRSRSTPAVTALRSHTVIVERVIRLPYTPPTGGRRRCERTPSVYFSNKQLEVLAELCSSWSTLLESASSEFIIDTAEFSEIIAEIEEKATKAQRQTKRKSIVEEGLRIAKRMEDERWW